MTFILKVYGNRIALPDGVHLPDGTEVQVTVVSSAEKRPSDSLLTFRGSGVLPGVDLNDNASIRRLLDEGGKFSQLP